MLSNAILWHAIQTPTADGHQGHIIILPEHRHIICIKMQCNAAITADIHQAQIILLLDYHQCKNLVVICSAICDAMQYQMKHGNKMHFFETQWKFHGCITLFSKTSSNAQMLTPFRFSLKLSLHFSQLYVIILDLIDIKSYQFIS